MSLLASFSKKSKLNATINQTAQARKSEGNTADGLFKAAYQGYAEVMLGDPIRAEALYHWGFALLHQAQTKSGDEAAMIFQDAIDKFAFCLLINPNYLGAAINSGVAYMDFARLKKVMPHDKLYESAKKQFEKANAIQAGTASYNLACIYGLRGDKEACLKALETSRDKVTLPDQADILSDLDMASVKDQDWFIAFMESLNKKPEAEPEDKQPVVDPTSSKWKLSQRKFDVEEDLDDDEKEEVVALSAEQEAPVEVNDVADKEPEEVVSTEQDTK
jgi:tetratricopeptide (TPR) repeat protein